MSSVKEAADTPWGAINRFFFAEEAPFGFALLRITLPWVLIFDAVRRWIWVREIYSSDGAPSPLGDNLNWPNFLPELSAPMAVALNTAMIFLLLTSSLGWYTRFSLVAATSLYYYFCMMDCISTLTKYNVVATHLMLLLAVSQCGDVWSVDRWLKTSHLGLEGRWSAPPRSGVWPQRLMQILLGMIYLGASFTKMHTPSFFSGDQLMYWMMTDIHEDHPLGNYLSQFPLLLVFFAYVTITWEIAFLFGTWGKWSRIPMLVIGAGFHIMTALTLGLFIFPIVMILSYLCFVTERDVFFVRGCLRRWGILKIWHNVRLPERISMIPWQQARWAVASAFAVATMLVMLGGVQAEQMLDVYKMRGPNGPLPLKEISADEARRLLKSDLTLDPVDKFLAVDLGLISISEHLLTRSNTFRQGDRIIVQVTFNPPHEDMWVECLFCEGVDRKVVAEAAKFEETTMSVDVPEREYGSREITRMAQVVPRENLRTSFGFITDRSMEPGEYTFKIRSGGNVVLKKTFTLLPNANAPEVKPEDLGPTAPSPHLGLPRVPQEQTEPEE